MRIPNAERRRFWAKVAVALGVESVVAPPLIALTVVRGQAPQWALELHNRLHQRMVAWLFPWARPEGP